MWKNIQNSLISLFIYTTKNKFKKKFLLKHLNPKKVLKIYKSNKLKKRKKNPNQKKLKKLFMNGNKLIPKKLYGWEIRIKFIKKTILTFSKVLVNNQIHQWIGFILILMVRLFLIQFFMFQIELHKTFTQIIITEKMT